MKILFKRTRKRLSGYFRIPAPISSILSPGHLHLLSLQSMILCIVAFFLVRIGDNLLLSAFAWLNNISQNFSLILITFPQSGQENWTEGKVLFIYTVPYLVYALAGIYLPHFISPYVHWRLKLFITWIFFHLLLMLIAGLFAGIYEYRGVGVALEWVFVNIWIRAIGVLVIGSLLIYNSRRYAWYFLRCLPNATFRTDSVTMIYWLRFQVMMPFLLSFTVILAIGGKPLLINYIISWILGATMIRMSYRVLPLILQNKMSLVKANRKSDH